MIWLIIGVLLWSGLHLISVLAPALKSNLHKRLGENAYKGMFSLGIVLSIILMVLGWRAATPVTVYTPLPLGNFLTMMLVFVAFQLFARSQVRTNTKRFIRNSQLTGIILWSFGHLIINGDDRSLILFGGLGVWAIIEIILLNRRDGPWQKPEPEPLNRELMPTLIGAGMFAVIFLIHGYISGVSLF